MAPQVPKKRTTARARTSRATHVPSTPSQDESSLFKSTKEDKRRIKHSNLVSRIEKANSSSKKRRRPNKKLVATLSSLADALPEAGDSTQEDAVAGAKIRHASLKSRPGALKRKEKLEGLERDRFQKNMAQMAAGQKNVTANESAETQSENATSGSSARWAALRGFIQSTMPKDTKTK